MSTKTMMLSLNRLSSKEFIDLKLPTIRIFNMKAVDYKDIHQPIVVITPIKTNKTDKDQEIATKRTKNENRKYMGGVWIN